MSQSVTRAARIIDVIAADPRTVAELAEIFGLHRSTMFRELQALEEVGWVRRRGSGRYTLGTRLVALSKEALDSLDLREAGSEHVRRLQRRTGNTVHLAALMDRSIVYVDKAEDESGVRMYSRIGKAVIPYCWRWARRSSRTSTWAGATPCSPGSPGSGTPTTRSRPASASTASSRS